MSEPNSLFSQLILIDISSTINFQKICQFGVHRVVKTNPLRVTYINSPNLIRKKLSDNKRPPPPTHEHKPMSL